MAEASQTDTTGTAPGNDHAREAAISRLVQRLSVQPGQAEKLYEAGLTTPEDVQTASEEKLKGIGFTDDEIKNLKGGVPADSVDSDNMLEKWLEIRAKTTKKRTHFKHSPAATPESDDLFKRWVAGDDTAFASWMKPGGKEIPGPEGQEAEPSHDTMQGADVSPAREAIQSPPSTPEAPLAKAIPRAKREPQELPTERGQPASTGTKMAEEFSKWLVSLSSSAPSNVDAEKIIKDGNDYLLEFQKVMARVSQLEDAVSAVKKGSVATIKFTRTRERRIREEAVAAKEAEIQSLKEKLDHLRVQTGTGPSTSSEPSKEEKHAPPATVAQMMEGIKTRERVLRAKEEEARAKEEELKVRLAEMEKMRNPVVAKEQEIIKWEQHLRIKEEQLKSEMRRFEADRKAMQDTGTLDKLRRLEDIESDITKKELEMKTREKYLQQRLDELQGKEREVVDAEVSRFEKGFKEDVSTERARTGVRRLDDLLIGGLPIGTNVLINGGKHTGKEVMARYLVAEGLRKMVPALWILTDTDPSTVREAMSAVLPTYEEYERRGIVKYIDLYSLNLGTTKEQPNVTLIPISQADTLPKIGEAVQTITQEFLKRSKYYRLVFQTISTLTAYLDTPDVMRFLQPFAGKRRRERGVSYYLVETGMHEEGDIDILEHLMDGSINLKVEQMKTFLSVKGILDEVQSRAWINYSFTRTTFDMGSFSLDHIR